MGEFVECVQGIAEASEYLKFPVVSGNVSFTIKLRIKVLNYSINWWCWFN